MAASRFRSLSEENIAQLLNDKDSENTKTSMKQHRLIFESYLKEKNIRNPTTAVELAAVLQNFLRLGEKKGWTDVLKKLPLFLQIFLKIFLNE